MLKRLSWWSGISDSEVALVKTWLGQQLGIPVPRMVNVVGGRMCRCTGPHGKTMIARILDEYGNITQSVEIGEHDKIVY